MKYPERMEIVERLPFESRVGFIAFCVDRCLSEARRHLGARMQLEQQPGLTKGTQLLWARAERGEIPDPARVAAVLAAAATYETPAATSEDVVYNADVTLVEAARMLTKGLRVLQDSEVATPRYVAGALEGPVMVAGLVYADGRAARNAELAVIDAALQRLGESAGQPFTRALLADLPDWPRAELSNRYAAGQLTGTADD